MRFLRLWFGLASNVSRRDYVLSGVGLMGLKYLLDAGAVALVTGRAYSPLVFLNPLMSARMEAIGADPLWLLWAMGVWGLVFFWIGLSMSVRRAAMAGYSPWWGLFFVLPGLNYLLMAALSLAPDRAALEPTVRPTSAPAQLGTAMVAVLSGALVALACIVISVQRFAEYGATLFFAAPVLVGAVAGAMHNRRQLQSLRSTVFIAVLTVVVSGGAVAVFALEGLVCLAMAAPLALVAAIFGAVIARTVIARRPPRELIGQMAWLVAAVPLLMAAETHLQPQPLLSVTTSIDIAAPPERVWPHVIAFSALPPPSEWLWKTGIAFPERATITGAGVGAVRHCEFSTGPFVEPITVWDAPNHLAFDVASQPPPLREWSPYRDIHPLHLDGYLRSRRGEFVLTAIPGGTRLTGTTWYTIEIYPLAYWSLWSDFLIHAIHTRVLAHIAAEST